MGEEFESDGIKTLAVLATADAFGDGTLAAIGATDIPVYGGFAMASVVPSNLVDKPALGNCVMPAFNVTITQDSAPDYLEPLYEAFRGGDRAILTGGLGYDTVRILALAIERSGGDTSAERLTEALTSERILADYLALYSTGTAYTDENHFRNSVRGA